MLCLFVGAIVLLLLTSSPPNLMNCCCHLSLYVNVRIDRAAAIGDAHRLQLDRARAVTALPEQTLYCCGHIAAARVMT